ncbi:MAG TPA: TonB-dependent receptor [Steroidobacteraceae bacterium]|nr:TonB-dependent receptor [Steroidobacteraceae bacterium]
MSLFIAAVPGPKLLHAQAPPDTSGNSLQEVVVSATLLRDKPAAAVPASVSVLDSTTLQAAGLQHFEGVLNLVPNLNWSGDTNRPRYFQIRGIGELDEYQGAPNPSVGFLIDDVDFSGIGTVGTLFDMDQVEVLRGPQGTRYGANALAGLIAMRSAAPADQFGARVELSGGDYDTRSYGAMVTGPVASLDSAFRIAVQQYTSNGFYHNAYLGRDNTDGDHELTARLRWRFEPANDLRLDLALFEIRINDGYDAWDIADNRTTESDQPGQDRQDSAAGSLKAAYAALGPATLTFIGTFANSHIRYAYDSDFGNPDLWTAIIQSQDPTLCQSDSPCQYRYTDSQLRERRTHTLEARLANTVPAGVNWLVGVYQLDLRESLADTSQGIYAPDPNDVYPTQVTTYSRFHSVNTAVFGALDGQWAGRWFWSLGARAERRSATYHDHSIDLYNPDPPPHDFAPVNQMWGGNAALEFQSAPGQRLYVSVGRGYKAGGFNLGVGLPPGQLQFEPESDVNVETGYKVDLPAQRLRVNADVFYTHRSGLQLQTGEQLQPDDPTTFVLYNVNAPGGRNYGLESDLAWRPADLIELGATVGLLNSRYHGLTLDGAVLPDRALPHAPSWQGSVSATLHGQGGLFLRADVTGRGSFYFDLPALDPYASEASVLLNLKAGVNREHWSADLWVRNVMNRSYAVRGFYFGDVPLQFNAQQFVQLGAPRQAGATVSYSFN